MILAILACVTLSAVVAPVDGWVPMAPDVDDPAAGDPPCVPGSWTVTTPRGSVTVTVACVGTGPASWEADLVLAATGGRSAETAGEDWTVYKGDE